MTQVRPGRRRALTGVALASAALTGAAVVVPRLLEVGNAPELRVSLEVTSLCLLLFAATVLSLPGQGDVRPTRDALVAGLVVLGLANGFFGVLPVVTDGRFEVDRGLAFYPWVAARFVAGGLFVLAALQRPRWGLVRTVVAGIVALSLVEGILLAVGAGLPVPLVVTADATVVVVRPLMHLVFEVVPGTMFAVGAVLAHRLHDETRAPVHLGLAVALVLQVFAQVNQVLHPAILGAYLTVADVFRFVSFLALLVGGVLQLERLYRARTRAVSRQAEDLTTQARMVDRLSALARQEHDMRTVVTHEFATPLAAIRAYAHVLATQAGTLPPSAREAIVGIGDEARRLTALLSRMDELRDLERDSFVCDLQPVRAQLLVSDAVQFVQGLLGVHPVRSSCPNVRVMADPVRFGQLLRNVVTNAARHAPPGSTIEIDGRCHDGHFELSVTDVGPGIPVEERNRVLERYARGSTAAGQAGQGIGLYVAARIAAAHGGSFTITDPPEGRGTRVVVTLELAA